MHQFMQLCRDNASREKNTTNFVRNGADSDIYIYDVIDPDWGVSALSVISAIAQAGAGGTLNIHINSPGGSVFEGRAIMAALVMYQGKTVAHIDSLCASAATSIALACSEVVMSQGAFFMIHNASSMAWGDKTALRNEADLLEKIEGAIVADYVNKTGKDEAEITAWMDAETWFTADEALAAGFVDRIADSKSKAGNAWNLSAYTNAPTAIAELALEPVPEPIRSPQTDPLTATRERSLALLTQI